ncbi:MAG: hypothetical protein C3F06_03005 [Candidatus Methanoperedenaceae archaeon]|nr:MAG: hypothetical protein C3F06_03005 [Candidatus Methanoperedenaceae archaeon]
MKFAQRCPKCGGFVQTKSVRKSIGLGFVEIPVAQFCLNPVCDWYQDFAETKEPEDIKEGFQLKIPSIKKPEFKTPEISKNQIIAISAIIGLIIIYALFSNLDFTGSDVDQKIQSPQSYLQNNTTLSETPNIPVPTTVSTPLAIEPKSYTVRVDVSHGFYPDVITINKSDKIIWSNEENLRPRVVLVSKNSLFEKVLMQYQDRYQFQFNRQGNYSFVLAEFPTNKEYQSKGNVIVR